MSLPLPPPQSVSSLLATRLATLAQARYASAPMVNASDVVWRRIIREGGEMRREENGVTGNNNNIRRGADIVYTQMIDSEQFVQSSSYRKQMLQTYTTERNFLIIQFCSNSPTTFSRACTLAQPYCCGCELNLGCPQRAARTGKYGAYLLDEEYHTLIVEMLSTARRDNPTLPILAKIRLLPSYSATLAFCRLLSPHIDVLTIHGRTRGDVEERRKGPANLMQIRKVVEEMRKDGASSSFANVTASSSSASNHRRRQPLLIWTNGNVRCDNDVEANITFTRANGCMVGEALLNDPTMFLRCALPPAASSSSSSSSSLSPSLSTYTDVDTLLTLQEFDRKLAIMEKYIQELQAPTTEYFAPFNADDVEEKKESELAAALSTLPSTSHSIVTSTSTITPTTFCTPLVSWSCFHSHIYHLFNCDTRARFLTYTQLADELLDAQHIEQVRAILQEVRKRVEEGREFDWEEQKLIDARKSQRQQQRATLERKRKRQEEVNAAGEPGDTAVTTAASSSRHLNSRERKRERWKEKKRRKLLDAAAAADDTTIRSEKGDVEDEYEEEHKESCSEGVTS